MHNQAFCPLGNTYIVAPGVGSAATRIVNGTFARIVNSGTVSCFIKFTKAGSAAAVTDMEIPAGQTEIFQIPPGMEFISYITASGTGNLNITTGEGP